MGLYASETSVPVERTQAEIKRECSRYGADSFMLGEEGTTGMIQFRIKGRSVKFTIGMPDRKERRFTHTKARGDIRDQEAAYKAWEQACRQKWRALLLFVKSALEAVHEGIVDFDEAFLPYMVLADGQTVGSRMAPMVKRAIEAGTMPRLSITGPVEADNNGKEH